MPILQVALIIIVIAVLLWAANTYIPMDGKIRQILNVFVVVAVIIWLLSLFGLFSGLSEVRTPHGLFIPSINQLF